MAFNTLLNPVLYPLLDIVGYFWTLLIISLVITIIVTLIYKYTTNQSLMKDLKNELKEFQKEIKSLKDKPEEAMKVQKRMMETNSKYMMHSFKPMLFTFLPIIIFFGWMTAHLGYMPILPGQEFSVTMNFDEGVTGNVNLVLPEGITSINGVNQSILAGQAKWVLKADTGEYLLTYNFNGQTYTNEVLITSEKTYKIPLTKIKKGGVKDITVDLVPIKLIKGIPLLGSIPWIGNFGWLGTYIIISIIFSTLLRKLLKIY